MPEERKPVKKIVRKVRRLKIRQPELSSEPKPMFPHKAEPVKPSAQEEVLRAAEKELREFEEEKSRKQRELEEKLRGEREAREREAQRVTSKFLDTMRHDAIRSNKVVFTESDLAKRVAGSLVVSADPVDASNFPLASQQKLSSRLKGSLRNYFIYSNSPELLGGQRGKPMFLGNVEVSVHKLDDFERPNSKFRDLIVHSWLKRKEVGKDHLIAHVEDARALWRTEKAMNCAGLSHFALDRLLTKLKDEHHWALFLPITPEEVNFVNTRKFNRFSSPDAEESEFAYWLKRL